MATTEEIVAAARDLGKLIATHQAAEKFEQTVKKLEGDVDAQRAFTDYQRQMQTVAEKQQKNEPIEVEDKRELEQLQNAVVRNAVLRDFQMAQMDYVDLMRRVDEAMSRQVEGSPVPDGAAPPDADGPQPAPVFDPGELPNA